MVGLFHLGNKSSPSRAGKSTDSLRPATPPPPPYIPNGHTPEVYATATTTTTTQVVTTTTQTTTHFFSMPLWRRRVQPPAAYQTSTAEKRPARASADELGALQATPPTVYLRDKDLPPTPPAEDGDTNVARRSQSNMLKARQDEMPASRDSLSIPASSASSSSLVGSDSSAQPSASTALLARAALGLSLPPLNLNPTPAPSGTPAAEVNTVSFMSPPMQPSPSGSKASMSMRRVKSFQRPLKDPGGESHAEVRERRRTRGLSLGPLQFGADDKSEKKEPERRKSLSRKSSFWSRKRVDSRTPAPVPVPAPSADTFLPRPSLPSMHCSSSSRLGSNGPVPPPINLEEPRTPVELRRRHSERTSSRSPVSSPEPISPRRAKRPQTADSPASPRAVSSFFPGTPPNFTLSPPHSGTPGSPTATAPVPQVAHLRPRSATNPPFLHRLSMNLFGSSSGSSSVNGSVVGETLSKSPRTSLSSSSRPSVSRLSPKVSMEIPRPHLEDESPEVYLQRLIEAVSKAEVAIVLASSADEFHAAALRAYISRFDFSGDPLDVALRRLLMDVGLPRETQQIDRVMEAFAERYRHCHPDIFVSEDHPYILAFSLIMLHTDAFNKSNKRKMTKADYIKNTRLPGVPPEVLDCFYDNIVFAPFIFIEDPLDVNGQRGLLPESLSSRRLSTLNMPSPGGGNSSGSTLLSKNNKIDPYYLITRNLLDDLRVDVHSCVPPVSPYFYQGTADTWDEDVLLRAFAKANVVEFAPENRYLSSPWFGLNVGGGPNTVVLPASPASFYPGSDVAALKVAKVGLMLRKEATLDGRKNNNRKWREWSVLLTGSQLLWSRDINWAGAIQTQIDAVSGEVPLHHGLISKPDEIMSLKDAVAVFDRSYNKYRNTFRVVMPDGRHFLLQVKEEREMNEWIACINYASAFKTAGVRMRSLGMSGKDIELTGHAAAVSHLRDLKQRNSPSPRIRSYGSSSPIVESRSSSQEAHLSQTTTDGTSPSESGVDEPVTPPMDHSSRLFKATFDQVKADLASGDFHGADSMSPYGRPRAYSLESTLQTPTSPSGRFAADSELVRLSSRSQIIKSKVRDLESQISARQTQLDTDLRFVRNVAVLTPFQRATRDRLQITVQNVARRVMQVRLEMEKLTCHRDVLSKDLCAEERDWYRTKKMALRAAAEKLHLERQRSLPRMVLSMYDDNAVQTRSSTPIEIPRGGHSLESERPTSSAADSFHSALEFADWTGSEERAQLSPNHLSSRSFESPTTTPLTDSSSRTSLPEPSQLRPPPKLSAQSSIDSTGTATGHTVAEPRASVSEEHFYPAPEIPEEQAEEWNKTRAAKRVSLVRLPSDLKMSSYLGRHARINSDMLGSDASTVTPSSPLRHSVSTPSTPFTSPKTIMDS